MGESMGNNDSEITAFKIIDNIRMKLEEIEVLASISEIKQRIRELIEVIDDETLNDKSVFMEKIYCKVKETSGVNEQLNTYMYLLYRSLGEGKISVKEAERLYDMYVNEYA